MKWGKKTVKYEIKKIIVKPVNRIVLFITTMIVIVFAILAVNDVSYIKNDGTTVHGHSAAKELAEKKNEWKGNLTKDTLLKVYSFNRENSSQEDEDIENDEAYSKIQGIMDIRDLINEAFSPADEYDYYRISKISKDSLEHFYSTRENGLDEYLDDAGTKYSGEEKTYILNKYESMQKPLYYEAADGWKTLLKAAYFPSILIIVILACAFLVSGIFSDEFKYKADSVFFAAKLGRNKAIMSKIYAGIGTITTVYWFEVILFTLIVLATLGINGANCLIQTDADNWHSIYNITFFQEYLITVVGAYIGCIFILSLSMLVSIHTKQGIAAITIPFFFVCVCPFLGRIPILSEAVNLLPGQLLQLNTLFKYIYLYCINGRVVGLIELVVLIYFVGNLFVIPRLYFSMRKTR